MTIGQSMQALREQREMTRAELAEKAGVCYQTIRFMEADMGGTSIYTVIQCANVLGVTLDEYVGRRIKNE